jgi:hypothetical protein
MRNEKWKICFFHLTANEKGEQALPIPLFFILAARFLRRRRIASGNWRQDRLQRFG